MYTDPLQFNASFPKSLEEIEGVVSPWYKAIGEPVIISSILAPGRTSFLDNFQFALHQWEADPANQRHCLFDIDSFRRIPMDEAISHLAIDPNASLRIAIFSQHFGYQFYRNTGNPQHYLPLP